MKRTLIHFAPFEPGDHPGIHPKVGTPRFMGLSIAMFEFGLLRADLRTVVRTFDVRYGTTQQGYIWRVVWDDEEPALLKNPV